MQSNKGFFRGSNVSNEDWTFWITITIDGLLTPKTKSDWKLKKTQRSFTFLCDIAFLQLLLLIVGQGG